MEDEELSVNFTLTGYFPVTWDLGLEGESCSTGCLGSKITIWVVIVFG